MSAIESFARRTANSRTPEQWRAEAQKHRTIADGHRRAAENHEADARQRREWERMQLEKAAACEGWAEIAEKLLETA